MKKLIRRQNYFLKHELFYIETDSLDIASSSDNVPSIHTEPTVISKTNNKSNESDSSCEMCVQDLFNIQDKPTDRELLWKLFVF